MSDAEEEPMSAEELRRQRGREAKAARKQSKKLHAIQDEVKGKDETTDAAEVCEILSKTNAVGGDKTDAATKVAILDAQINCDVARLGLKVVKAQNKDMQQFTQKDFVIRLVQRYNLMDDDEDDSRGVNLDWNKMRGEAASFFDATPSCHFLAGAMSKQVAQKARKAREAPVRRQKPTEAEPTYGQSDDKDHKQTSEKRKNQLSDLLDDTGEIPMPNFIINPSSFGESVENLFAMGVMVSDGHAGVKSVGGKLHVYPTGPSSKAEKRKQQQSTDEDNGGQIDGLPRCIIKFDYDMFLQACNKCSITKKMFTFDPDAQDALIQPENEEDQQSAAKTLASESQQGGASKKRRQS